MTELKLHQQWVGEGKYRPAPKKTLRIPVYPEDIVHVPVQTVEELEFIRNGVGVHEWIPENSEILENAKLVNTPPEIWPERLNYKQKDGPPRYYREKKAREHNSHIIDDTSAEVDIYKAFDDHLRRWVAIKKLSTDNIQLQRRLEIEAKTQARFPKDPHRVEAYDFWIETKADGSKKNLYLVMEWMQHGSLDQLLAGRSKVRSQFQESEVLTVVHNTAETIDAGHKQKIIHNDLKPGNIFPILNDEGLIVDVKVGDFGLANWVLARVPTEEDMVTGTPAYMSPSRLKGEAPTLQSEIYALALIAFETMVGERFFNQPDFHVVLQAISKLNPARVIERLNEVGIVDSSLEQIFIKALTEPSEYNYAKATEFSHAFAAALTKKELPPIAEAKFIELV